MTARRPLPATPPPAIDAGFSLIELTVVIVILGLIATLVQANMGAMVPQSKLDSTAKQLVSYVDFLHSESRIQGKRFILQLDLAHSRWRYVLPAEQRLTSDQAEDSTMPLALDWKALEDGVVFMGAGNATDGMVRSNSPTPYEIVFDENGFTADQIVSMTLATDPTMVWTVQIHGINGSAEIITNYNGQEERLEEMGEGSFL